MKLRRKLAYGLSIILLSSPFLIGNSVKARKINENHKALFEISGTKITNSTITSDYHCKNDLLSIIYENQQDNLSIILYRKAPESEKGYNYTSILKGKDNFVLMDWDADDKIDSISVPGVFTTYLDDKRVTKQTKEYFAHVYDEVKDFLKYDKIIQEFKKSHAVNISERVEKEGLEKLQELLDKNQLYREIFNLMKIAFS
jgi:hypothetical protein